MADPKKGGGGGGAKVGSVHKSGWLGWVAIIALVALTSRFWTKLIPTSCDFGSSAKTAVASEPKKSEQPKEQQRAVVAVKVKLHPRDWSESISFAKLKPTQVPDSARGFFQVNAPDWHQYRFWNGKETPWITKGEQWLGDIPTSTFRLRGQEGEATVLITYVWP